MPTRARPQVGLLLVRYGLGALLVAAGIVLIAVNPGGLGVDGFAMAAGGGLSVLLINFLYRLGVSGDREREREEEARRYLDEHGVWPDEPAVQPGRRWTLAPGVVTPEDEAAQEAQRREDHR
jgi:hypothetical protein